MTEPEERKGRTRHVLRRSSQREADAEAETAAVEPESVAIEETVEAPVADEPADEAAVEPGDETVERDVPPGAETVDPPAAQSNFSASRTIAFVVLPVLAFLLVLGVGALKFIDVQSNLIDTARDQAMQTAKDSTITLLSYNPDTVEQQLTAARALLTGEFKESYTQLTTNVVIPGAKQQRISAVATVPRAASVSIESDRAVVLLFVNQTVVVGDSQPSATLSSVRVTLDKVDDKWLVSKFDPV